MNWQDVRVDRGEVTWGTGEIRAQIKLTNPASQTCVVELTKDYESPCGHVWEKGSELRVPAVELRYVQ